MPKALLGKKVGMTRVFDDDGRAIPVTVIALGPCTVMQVRDAGRDGYSAVQLGFEDRVTGEQWDTIKRRYAEGKLRGNLKGLRRPEIGRCIKAGVVPQRFLREVGLTEGESLEVGEKITVSAAESWQKVDVIGRSKGRGTQGTMGAWGFKSGPNTHGSKNRRNPGSIGMGATPSRVLKGKKMYTRWGDERCTVRNLDVVKVDAEHDLLLVKGAIPGAKQGYVLVRKAVAARVKPSEAKA